MKKLKQKFLFAHMEAAKAYAKLSHCKRLKVGAILLTKEGMTAQGYNGRPAGEPNVGETDEGVTHPDVRHAEVNALKKITRSTESSVGSVMFTTHMPCRQCSIDMVDAGVSTVIYEETYRDDSGVKYLLMKGVNVYHIDNGRLFYLCISGDGLIQQLYRSEDRCPEIVV